MMGLGARGSTVNIDARSVTVNAPVIDSVLIASALTQLATVAALPTNGKVHEAEVVERNGGVK